jgi:hypothetical protein
MINGLGMSNSDWDIADPTPQKGEAPDHCERCLWCAVLALALADVRQGDLYARNWFKGRDFAMCAHILGLSVSKVRHIIEHSIRDEIDELSFRQNK